MKISSVSNRRKVAKYHEVQNEINQWSLHCDLNE